MRWILLTAALLSSTAFAHERTCSFPQNNLYFSELAGSGLSKGTFENIIKRTVAAYQSIARENGAELIFNNLWSDGTVNSDTYLDGNTWFVDAYGGLARYPGMTATAYQLVLCHEIGHHMGGLPRYYNDSNWASVEGQADYWATEVCMKHLGIASDGPALSLSRVFAGLLNEPMPQVKTPDQAQVSENFESHPPAQCRLDTYRAGRRNQSRPGCWFAHD